jgi:hypothetical protein
MAIVEVDARKNRDGDAPITDAQRDIIQYAADDAEHSSTTALGVLNAVWNQPGTGRTRRQNRKDAWRANANIVRWFGSDKLTNDEIRDTRRRLRRVQEEFDDEVRFTIIQHQTGRKSFLCNNQAHAYCSPGTPVKVCPSFFLEGNRQQRAKLLIHELSHKNGHVHHDGATDSASALQLALDDPREARRNPENYAGFCDEYYRPI